MPVKKSSGRHHKPEKKTSRPNKRKSIEDFVKEGVERFIMRESTIEDFLKTMRSASGKGFAYTHQLTQEVFSKIVKEAIRKRKRQGK
ncbi:hypothetical protein FBQ87_07585 [Sphingobacteriales bacterium CHB3]|nr:hypothetical protein [Sphingobacteriales bacterium CHB3]